MLAHVCLCMWIENLETAKIVATLIPTLYFLSPLPFLLLHLAHFKFFSTPAWTYIAVDVTILIAPFLRNPLTAKEMYLLFFYPAFDDKREKLQTNAFKVK